MIQSEKLIIEKGICEVFEEIFSKDYWESPLSYGEETKIILEYCNKNNFYLYEKPKEDYFPYEGFKYALDNGFDGVIYSNLS